MIIHAWEKLKEYSANLLDLDHECFGKSCWTSDIWKKLFLNRNLKVILNVQSSILTAFIAYSIVHPEVELLKIAVKKEYRRQSIGNQLIDQMLNNLASLNGPGNIYLEVRSDNQPAIEFYKSHGFKISGIRRSYYANPPADAINMTRKLIKL